MPHPTEKLSLLAALTQCFEKDEMIGGYHHRVVPFCSEERARERFKTWRAELERWFGAPEGEDSGDGRQRVWWSDVRMKRSERGISMWIASARVHEWWNDRRVWQEPGLDGTWSWDDVPGATRPKP